VTALDRPRPARRGRVPGLVAALALAALAPVLGCGGNNQTVAIPEGSGTLGPDPARLEQHYTASLGTAALTSAIRPHWTFTVTATATGAGAGTEAPVVRMSVFQDTLTIPSTVDLDLSSGSATGTAVIEADSDCQSGSPCSLGFTVRFERQDADASDVAVSWSGTLNTAVESELGDTSPGQLVIAAD
jgi:hypothetical protein